jgi:undecaprenyl-diphosphatase
VNAYLLALLFGIVEGVTEFLPVSSTAHLRLLKPLCGIAMDDPFWKMFDVVIQLGAVLCLPVFFKREITEFVRTFPRGRNGDRDPLNHPLSLTLLAFVVTALPAFVLKKVISHNLENLSVIGAALLIGGAVMWAVDALCTRPRTIGMEQMNWLQAAWIGAVQILSAVFPGTSRSMSTIAAGQVAGLSRATALEFSFFVSMPTMFVACGYDLLKTLRPGHDEAGLTPLVMDGSRWLTLAIGFVVSFIVAWVVVGWFMGWVRRRGFVPFAIYRIVLGLGILFWLHRHATA